MAIFRMEVKAIFRQFRAIIIHHNINYKVFVKKSSISDGACNKSMHK
jgi:hypothetical protein